MKDALTNKEMAIARFGRKLFGAHPTAVVLFNELK